jgi:hypothetical protein
VLYVSGYSDEALSDHDAFDHELNFLKKPFELPELLRRIRSILAA